MFNCAASINMNATLKKSLECNVTSLIEVLNLCRGMKNLKSLVVVSTVYSNCNRSVIEERICSSPISPELAYRLCSEVDNTTLEKIVPL